MKRNVRLMVLAILVLFAMPLVVNAEPLESFAENPIPYWDDDSVDVDVSWSEEQQTVDFDLPIWEEDMSDVSDWSGYGAEAGDTMTSDGDVATIVFHDDDNSDNWQSAIPTATYEYLEIRYKYNTTDYGSCVAWGILEGGLLGAGGSAADYGSLLTSTSWQIEKIWIGDNADITGVYFYLNDVAGEYEIDVDYWRMNVYNGTLDVGVPLEPDITQSVEFMGNFSALNSTVRFEMYDNTTASGLFCDVNSTQVTFPDATYAKFTDFARINFSLNEETIIFRIYVSAQNTTLINYYSFYVGLANKDYLRMNDSVFEGSYELWYLQGDLGYLEDIVMTDNIFYLLFLSTEMWGYIGPIALVIIGYFVFKKDRILGILFFVVECLFIANYIKLVSVTPDYWWHIVILLFGGLFTCVFPLWDR